MALRASLVISGDAGAAVAALNATDAALEGNEQAAVRTANAYRAADQAIRQLANAQATAKRETDQTKAAFAAGEISLEQYSRELLETKSALSLFAAQHQSAMAVVRSSSSVMAGAAVSAGQQRAAYTNLGRQAQDVAVQLQMGTNIGSIVAMQGGQVADAVAMMGGRFAGLASFLAGPWGAAVIVGAGVLLNQLIPALFGASDAAEQVEFASYGLSDAQSVLGRVMDTTTGKINVQAGALLALARAQALAGQIKARSEMAEARSDMSAQAEMRPHVTGGFGGGLNVTRGRDAVGDLVASVLDGTTDPQGAIGGLNSMVKSGYATEEAFLAAASAITKYAVAQENLKVFQGADRMLTGQGTAADRALLLKPGKADKPKRDRAKRGGGDPVEFGEDTAAKIARITDQFSDLPPVIARSNDAMRQLDDIASDVEKKKPPNYAALKASLAGARDVIRENLTKPLDDYLEKANQTAAIDQLVLRGKRDEALALQDALALQRQMGPLTEQQLGTILETVAAERQRGELLQQQQEMIGNYLDATRSVRSEIEGILSGTGKLSNLPQIFKNLQGKVLAEKLFGSMFRDLDHWVQDDSGIKNATTTFVDNTKAAGTAAFDLAAAFRGAGGQIRAAAAGGGLRQGDVSIDALSQGPLVDETGAPTDGSQIVVTANVPKSATGSLLDVSVDEYMRKMTQGTAKSLTDALNGVAGTQFFSKFTGSIGGAMEGYMVSGGSPFGAALGALKELPGLPKGIADRLGGAFKGMATGSQIAGLAGAFGIKLSKTGAQVGGAIGGALPIPGGAIIGSLLGGALGGLFKKAKTGAVSIGNVNGEGAVTGTAGNNADRKAGATGLGTGINATLTQLAERLGGSLGNFAVAIGQRNDEFRVSASGSASATTKKKTSSDIIYKGKDEAAATSAALANAIADGAITGLSDAVQRAIKANSANVDKALAEALKVEDLEAMLGGLAGAIDKAFADFERQAKERLRVAKAYGFDVVKVEELNAKERLKLSQQLLEQQVGSLQRLIDEMTSGSLFEGTAVDRRTSLLDDIAKAKVEADAGTEGAGDKLANLLDQLNAVSKDVYGTTGGFASDRTTILDQARDVIAKTNQRISDAQAKSDPALATTNAALDENNSQNAEMIVLLRDIGGGLSLPSVGVSNFEGLARLASTRVLQ